MRISAAEFKARCLKLLDEVAETHEPLVITKRGRPVAQVVPVEPDDEQSFFGSMKGTIEIRGDVISPIDETWSADNGDEDPLYEAVVPGPE